MAAGGFLQMAGAGISAYGTYQAGQAKSNADAYNASVALENASLVQAEDPVRVEQARRQGEQAAGFAKAQFGASGVNPNSGSPLSIMQSDIGQTSLNESLIEQQDSMKEFGYQTNAALDIYDATQAQTAAGWGATAAIVGGAGPAAANTNFSGNTTNSSPSTNNTNGNGNGAMIPSASLGAMGESSDGDGGDGE